MKIENLDLSEVKLLEPEVFGDARGYFFESYNATQFSLAAGQEINFVQDNESRSKKGVLRGLHYQLPPFAQAKLVRVVSGAILDVAVDIRRSSKTFGKYVSAVISDENKKQIWIPEGFAHGFLALSNDTIICYKTTNYYSKAHERSINYKCSDLNIAWPQSGDITISEKDGAAPSFSSAEVFD